MSSNSSLCIIFNFQTKFLKVSQKLKNETVFYTAKSEDMGGEK